MWFPPYDLSVSENITTNWSSNDFSRPEPIYTYNNTSRQGQLNWKIVVDHPSVLNVMVDKELQNNDKINEIVDSFLLDVENMIFTNSPLGSLNLPTMIFMILLQLPHLYLSLKLLKRKY